MSDEYDNRKAYRMEINYTKFKMSELRQTDFFI